MLVHPEDLPRVARDAFELFQKKYPNNPAGITFDRHNPGAITPGWDGLPESTRAKWRDLVNDFNREPRLLAIASPNTMEACVTAAINAYTAPPPYDPDAEIAKLQQKGGK
jgi:hypothetical protein